MTCAELSAAEPLAGTAATAASFLLLEHRERWGRDPLDDETALPADVRAAAERFDGRVLLIRRPDRREGPGAAFVARVAHGGGALWSGLEAVDGAALDAPLVLVCTHGRRDRCCARLGVPVFDALAPHVDASRLWQSSHHGGHRFAANVLVLPGGIQLGRVGPGAARAVSGLLEKGRIPLEHYRGRTLDSPRIQAADAEVRRVLGLDEPADVRPLEDDGSLVRLETPSGVIDVHVEARDGPVLPVSCGAEPERTTHLVARIGT